MNQGMIAGRTTDKFGLFISYYCYYCLFSLPWGTSLCNHLSAFTFTESNGERKSKWLCVLPLMDRKPELILYNS